MYYSEKVSDKSDILTHQSKNLFKKKNNSDKHFLHQNQIVLKKHNLDDKVIQNLQNKIIIIQKLNLEITFIFTHEIEFIIILIHC